MHTPPRGFHDDRPWHSDIGIGVSAITVCNVVWKLRLLRVRARPAILMLSTFLPDWLLNLNGAFV